MNRSMHIFLKDKNFDIDEILFRLTTQCEKCGEQLYPGLQETSSNSCKCKKQQTKGSFT